MAKSIDELVHTVESAFSQYRIDRISDVRLACRLRQEHNFNRHEIGFIGPGKEFSSFLQFAEN